MTEKNGFSTDFLVNRANRPDSWGSRIRIPIASVVIPYQRLWCAPICAPSKFQNLTHSFATSAPTLSESGAER
jgi:hypothetical protein